MKINLPQTFKLFRNVSAMVGLKQVEQPNATLNIGIFSENTGSVKQLDFLKSAQPETIKKINYNENEYGSIDTQKGAQVIPSTNDFWVGDPL